MSRVFSGAALNPNENYIHTPASAVYNNLTALTYAAWIFPLAGAQNGTVIAKNPTGAYVGFYYSPAGSQAQVPHVTSGAISVITNVPTPSTWSHIAMTYNEAGDKLVHVYLNGTECGYSIHTAGVGALKDDSGDGFYFGDDTFDDAFNGNIAEIVVYNTVLSAGQVASLATSTTGATAVLPKNIVGYWPLYGNTSPEPDVSGNNNYGTLSANAPTSGPASTGTPVYSSTDSRKSRNLSVNVEQTLTYTVPYTDSRTAGAPVDSRTAIPVDSRASKPVNSRTPGAFGPGV